MCNDNNNMACFSKWHNIENIIIAESNNIISKLCLSINIIWQYGYIFHHGMACTIIIIYVYVSNESMA